MTSQQAKEKAEKHQYLIGKTFRYKGEISAYVLGVLYKNTQPSDKPEDFDVCVRAQIPANGSGALVGLDEFLALI